MSLDRTRNLLSYAATERKNYGLVLEAQYEAGDHFLSVAWFSYLNISV